MKITGWLLTLFFSVCVSFKGNSQETFNYSFFNYLLSNEAYESASSYLNNFPASDSINYCKQVLLFKTGEHTTANGDTSYLSQGTSLIKDKTIALTFYNKHKSQTRKYNTQNIVNESYILFYKACIVAYNYQLDSFSYLLSQHKLTDNNTHNASLDEAWNALELLVLEHSLQHHKNKNIATIASLIVPGLGKAYLVKPRQAISAFTGIALLSAEAWEAYNKGGIKSPLFIAFGGMAMLFYLGNIYGTYYLNKASISKQNKNYHEKIMAIMGPMLVE